MTIQEKYNLRKVINARGPATILGASKVSDAVRQDIYDILGESVETWELQRRANEAIVKLTGAEAGCVVGCCSAGMAIATAACLTGDNISRIKALPDVTWDKKKVLIQKGQVTGAGDCPVYQVIKICGAQYIEIGEALDCATYHLRDALDKDAAAAFFIMGDVFAPNLLPLDVFVSICKEKDIPVIVDAAYLTDFRMLAKIGVDLAIYSGQKWLGGCTSGIVAGRKDLVHACYLQELGIGRPMKVGKEGMIGIISTINQWLNRDSKAIISAQTKLATNLKKCIEKFDGVTCKIEQQHLYSPSVRLVVDIDRTITKIPAWVINDEIGKLDPVVKTDDYYVNNGRIIFDFTLISPGEEMIIAEYFEQLLSGQRAVEGYSSENIPIPETRQDVIHKIFEQWLDGNPRE